MSKYLGQHFLKNKKKIKKIVETLDLKPNETVIEIGAGHGEVTDELRSKNTELNGGLKIIIIEKDRRLVQFLKQKIQSRATLSCRKARKVTLGCKNENKCKNGNKNENARNIEILEGDALKILPNPIIQLPYYPIANYKLVGNIPYYITGRLLRIVGELKRKPKLIVLTIQKEVAERICAQPPETNLLAASVQFWAEPKIIGYISKKDFRPMPKVDSAIIKLTPKPSTLNVQPYYKFIKVLFKQPRKTILNNLISNFQFLISKNEAAKRLRNFGINPLDRPQNLSVEQIIELSTLF